jgi:Spy/CpxP family protein refolding chaperone
MARHRAPHPHSTGITRLAAVGAAFGASVLAPAAAAALAPAAASASTLGPMPGEHHSDVSGSGGHRHHSSSSRHHHHSHTASLAQPRQATKPAALRPMSSGEQQYRNGCRDGYITDGCTAYSVGSLLDRGINPDL